MPSAHESIPGDLGRAVETCRHLLRQHSYPRLHLSSSITRNVPFCSISGRFFLHVFIIDGVLGRARRWCTASLFPSDLVGPLFGSLGGSTPWYRRHIMCIRSQGLIPGSEKCSVCFRMHCSAAGAIIRSIGVMERVYAVQLRRFPAFSPLWLSNGLSVGISRFKRWASDGRRSVCLMVFGWRGVGLRFRFRGV